MRTPSPFNEQIPASLPLWREGFVVAEVGLLRLSPIYYGRGVPRGDGSAVLAVPGFCGTDDYLFDLRRWLGRIGYSAFRSGVGHNADCLNRSANRLLETAEEAVQRTGRKAHVIGHSLGGILARGAAILRPELFQSVTTMGSPIRGIRSHPLVMRIGDAVRRSIQERDDAPDPFCFSGECSCELVTRGQGEVPEGIHELAIYTKADGVVAWKMCRHGDNERDAEVTGTHCGLAFNPSAYGVLGRFLARSQENSDD